MLPDATQILANYEALLEKINNNEFWNNIYIKVLCSSQKLKEIALQGFASDWFRPAAA